MSTTPDPSPFEANVQLAGVMARAETAAIERALERLDDEHTGEAMTMGDQVMHLGRYLDEDGYPFPGGPLKLLSALQAAASDVREQGAYFSSTAALAEFLHKHATDTLT